MVSRKPLGSLTSNARLFHSVSRGSDVSVMPACFARFAIEDRWEENGTLLGVMLRADRTQIGLNQDDWKKGRDRKKGVGVRLSISTTRGNVDEIARRARNAGITLKSDPHDTEWKSRAFEVSDPSGFLLTIFSETSA